MLARAWEFESPLRHHKKISGLAEKQHSADPLYFSLFTICPPIAPLFRESTFSSLVCIFSSRRHSLIGQRKPFVSKLTLVMIMTPASFCGRSPLLGAAAFLTPAPPVFQKTIQNGPIAARSPENSGSSPALPPMWALATPARVNFLIKILVGIWEKLGRLWACAQDAARLLVFIDHYKALR